MSDGSYPPSLSPVSEGSSEYKKRIILFLPPPLSLSPSLHFLSPRIYHMYVLLLTSIALVSILVNLNGIFSGNFSRVIATSKQSPKSIWRIRPVSRSNMRLDGCLQREEKEEKETKQEDNRRELRRRVIKQTKIHVTYHMVIHTHTYTYLSPSPRTYPTMDMTAKERV